jgi:hypothetical protein
MAKKREIIDSAVSQIIRHVDKKHSSQGDKPDRKPNPLGVVLDHSELERLDAAATEIGINRHQTMQFAIRQFLADFEKGRRPKTTTKTITIIEPD